MSKGWTRNPPPDTWVGFDTRRYLLAEDPDGIAWAWFKTHEGGWDHTLDRARGVLWKVYEPASADDCKSLARHVENIAVNGCGARGYCGDHHRERGR